MTEKKCCFCENGEVKIFGPPDSKESINGIPCHIEKCSFCDGAGIIKKGSYGEMASKVMKPCCFVEKI